MNNENYFDSNEIRKAPVKGDIYIKKYEYFENPREYTLIVTDSKTWRTEIGAYVTVTDADGNNLYGGEYIHCSLLYSAHEVHKNGKLILKSTPTSIEEIFSLGRNKD